MRSPNSLTCSAYDRAASWNGERPSGVSSCHYHGGLCDRRCDKHTLITNPASDKIFVIIQQATDYNKIKLIPFLRSFTDIMTLLDVEIEVRGHLTLVVAALNVTRQHLRTVTSRCVPHEIYLLLTPAHARNTHTFYVTVSTFTTYKVDSL